MNVCTHAPNFYNNQNVISECKAFKDRDSCFNNGKCLWNDCSNLATSVAGSTTTAAGISSVCQGTDTCLAFNGDQTPGMCVKTNDPPVPVSFTPNSCTHVQFGNGIQFMTERCL